MRYYVTIKDIKSILNIKNAKYVDFSCDGKPVHVGLARQKTGFGYKVFIVCPRCGSRRVKLYMYRDKLICRDCYPVRVYKTRQDSTDGGYEEITYRMNRLAARYDIKIVQPFVYYQLHNNKPKNMHQRTWERLLRQLQILANMRFQAIIYRKRYSAECIRYVLKNCLYLYSLYDMEKYLIDWQGCIENVKSIDKIC